MIVLYFSTHIKLVFISHEWYESDNFKSSACFLLLIKGRFIALSRSCLAKKIITSTEQFQNGQAGSEDPDAQVVQFRRALSPRTFLNDHRNVYEAHHLMRAIMRYIPHGKYV